MAQNISLLGAVYSNVPSIVLPKSPSGTATFTDVTDTTAVAADVAAGKYFYAADGSRTLGTGSGGGGTGGITQDQDGYLVLSDQGGGGGGGGLEFEEGTFEPVSDISQPTINFANAHTTLPFVVMMYDTTQTIASTDSNLFWGIHNWYGINNASYPLGDIDCYARVGFTYKNSSSQSASGSSITQLTGSTNTCMPYHLSESSFSPSSNSASRYWRTGHTYKWIAVWKPTT